MKKFWNLRTLLTVLMGLTAIMTLLGGVGSTCVAFNAEQYPPFKMLVPYKGVFQMLVYISVIVAIAMMVATYWTACGNKWFFLAALIPLIIGGGAAAVQMYYSSSLRQISFFAAAPTNVRLYITLITLAAFVLIRLTPWWGKAGLDKPSTKPGSSMQAGGVAMIVAGLAMLTTPLWAGQSHMVEDYNLVLTLETPIVVDGLAMIVIGTGLLFAGRLMALVQTRWAALSNQ